MLTVLRQNATQVFHSLPDNFTTLKAKGIFYLYLENLHIRTRIRHKTKSFKSVHMLTNIMLIKI